MKFAQLFKTNENLISQGALMDLAPPKTIDIDPDHIPERVLSKLTPTLEEENKVDFPSEYVPDTLSGLNKLNESLNYNSNLAHKSMGLLSETMENLVPGEELSAVSVKSISTQIRAVNDSLGNHKQSPEEYLDKLLTSDGPYPVKSVMESLSVAIGGLKDLSTVFLDIPVFTNNHLKAGRYKINTDELANTRAALEKNLYNDAPDTYAGLVQFAEKMFDGVRVHDNGYKAAEEIKETMSSTGPLVPLIVIRYFLNSIRRITVNTSRRLSTSDLYVLKSYLGKVILFQENLNNALSKTTGILGDVSASNVSEGYIEVSKLLKQFFLDAVVNSNKESDTKIIDFSISDKYTANIELIQSGPSLYIDSSGVGNVYQAVNGDVSHGYFSPKDMKSVFECYQNHILPQVSDIKTNCEKTRVIVDELKKLVVDKSFSATSEIKEYTEMLDYLSKAIRFTDQACVAGLMMVEDIEYCLIQLGNGVAILSSQ